MDLKYQITLDNMIKNELDGKAAAIATYDSMLTIGFSYFAALLDYSFMKSKLRVVNYRDKLTKLAYKRAKKDGLDAKEDNDLLECLKNSGERLEGIDWSRRTGRWRPLLIYGGTFIACAGAAVILAL